MTTAYESDTLETLDSMANIFDGIDPKHPPTLKEAFEEMGLPEDFINDAIEEGGYFVEGRQEDKRLPKPLPMSLDEASAIYNYTTGGIEQEDAVNLFLIVNQALSTKDNKRAAVERIRKYLFLLFSGLRKLPRVVPEDNILYRGLRTHVSTEAGGEGLPYAVDCVKTWWGFTSTSTERRSANCFLKDFKNEEIKSGTMLTIRGRIWGYDISEYSFHGSEREFLVEPERRMKVVQVERKGNVINVDVEMLETEIPLLKKLPPRDVQVKAQKELPVDQNISVPNSFWAEKVWWNGAKLRWNNIAEGRPSYQLGIPKRLFVSTRITPKLKMDREECELNDLEPGKEYKFYIRAGNGRAWGPWSSSPICFDTPLLSPPGRFLVKNTAYNELEISWEEVPSAPFIRTMYRVEAETDDGSKRTIYEGTAHAFHHGLDTKKAIKFRVQAGVDSRWSKWSPDVRGRWVDVPVPAGIKAEVEGGRVCVASWDKVGGRNITYQVAVALNGSTDFVIGSATKEQHYEHESEAAAPITSAKLKVRACLDSVAGPWSETVSL